MTMQGKRTRPRVLVVEDDPDTRRLLVTALADEGYEPVPALDGRHAMRTALASNPSAIVLDLMLPEADGQDFVQAYREHARTTEAPPIVVVSARHDAAEVARRIGARDCVAKPFNVARLMERVATLVA